MWNLLGCVAPPWSACKVKFSHLKRPIYLWFSIKTNCYNFSSGSNFILSHKLSTGLVLLIGVKSSCSAILLAFIELIRSSQLILIRYLKVSVQTNVLNLNDSGTLHLPCMLIGSFITLASPLLFMFSSLRGLLGIYLWSVFYFILFIRMIESVLVLFIDD